MNDSQRGEQPPIDVAIEAAVVRELGKTYDSLNGAFFKNRLRRPVIGLSDTPHRFGRWMRATRTLDLARSLVIDHGWGAAVEVLKHEMAHQFVDEILGCGEEPAHGPAFRRVCDEHAIDYRASGLPSSGPIDDQQKRVLERVVKLLALAESSNLHEAQSAMNAAQRQMLKHNIDTIGAGAASAYSFRHLGKPTGRVDASQRILATIVGDHFFVEAIWVPAWRPLEGKRGSILEVCGTEANLEIAEYAHTFLTETAERLWREYRRTHGVGGDRDRRSFIAGVMSGFREKLDGQRRESRGQGLVWVGDAGLHKYFRRRHPYVRTTRYAAQGSPQAHRHGREAGKKIVLNRAVERGESGTVRLLPAKSALK